MKFDIKDIKLRFKEISRQARELPSSVEVTDLHGIDVMNDAVYLIENTLNKIEEDIGYFSDRANHYKE
jgi:hypothetical protein